MIRKKVGWEDMERVTGIRRTEVARPTRADAERMERKILGPKWGKKK